jgi:NAD(P)-dependent dehydrogenase (short-subunit alcohol dehydrogenase family)
MMGFTKSLSQEIATRNVTVNCVAPGFIESAMTGKQKEAIMGLPPRLSHATLKTFCA